jgi:hypothetical protein
LIGGLDYDGSSLFLEWTVQSEMLGFSSEYCLKKRNGDLDLFQESKNAILEFNKNHGVGTTMEYFNNFDVGRKGDVFLEVNVRNFNASPIRLSLASIKCFKSEIVVFICRFH